MFSMFDANVGSDGSAIATAIEQATDPMLMHADWSRNLDICDLINDTNEGQISATKMLRKQLRSENPKTVMLALELTDACVKNCSPQLHSAVANKQFLGDIQMLAEGKRGWEARDEALKLIQEWDKSFYEKRGEFPGFYELYASLKTKGANFPNSEQSAPVFTPPPAMFDESPQGNTNTSSLNNNITNSTGNVNGTQQGGDDLSKLKDDLGALQEKINLCREMLPESPGIEHDETLAEVIGFLEACQPRMVDLVEAGMMGMLGEDLLSVTLQVNDDLIKTLEAERTGTPLPKVKPPVTSEANTTTSSSGGGGGGGGGGAAEEHVDSGANLLDLDPSSPSLDTRIRIDSEEPELEMRKKGKNKQRGTSPPNTAGRGDVPVIAPPSMESRPVRSTGRFVEEPTLVSTPAVVDPVPTAVDPVDPAPVDPFASQPPPIDQSKVVLAQNVVVTNTASSSDPFANLSAPPPTANNPTTATMSFDPFAETPAPVLAPAPPVQTSPPPAPANNDQNPFAALDQPKEPAPDTNGAPVTGSYNPFDFDAASSYVAPSSSEIAAEVDLSQLSPAEPVAATPEVEPSIGLIPPPPDVKRNSHV